MNTGRHARLLAVVMGTGMASAILALGVSASSTSAAPVQNLPTQIPSIRIPDIPHVPNIQLPVEWPIPQPNIPAPPQPSAPVQQPNPPPSAQPPPVTNPEPPATTAPPPATSAAPPPAQPAQAAPIPQGNRRPLRQPANVAPEAPEGVPEATESEHPIYLPREPEYVPGEESPQGPNAYNHASHNQRIQEPLTPILLIIWGSFGLVLSFFGVVFYWQRRRGC